MEPGKLMPMDVTGRCQAEATPPHLYPQFWMPSTGQALHQQNNQPTNASSTGPVVG